MQASRQRSLTQWLAYLETLHPKPIAMGLDRVREVLRRLALRIACPLITVAGTNGKGSTCAMLERILRSAGYRTALYTSPHLLRYNERVRIAGEEVDDRTLVAAFEVVEDARAAHEAVALTYFEFGTLAALYLFARARPDALVLEVGLGGRLDAVNVLDADVAVVTSVDIDHVEYLGPDRASIGREKAGIFRRGRPAICGDADPPEALLDAAATIGAPLALLGRDFGFVPEPGQWRYWGPGGSRYALPMPALRGAYQLGNAATALAALDAVNAALPIHAGAVRQGLLEVEVPGRFQVLPGRPVVVLDVAHNPQAARALAATLGTMGHYPRTVAVFGMLRDKDIAGVVEAVRGRIDAWYLGSLGGPRGASAESLRIELLRAGVAPESIACADSVASAFLAARERAGQADRIVAFGSFLTVAAALPVARASAPPFTAHG